MSNRKIYIHFVDGTDAYIPVDTEIISENAYKLLPNDEFDYEDDTILFEYGAGDIVTAEMHKFESGDTNLKASKLIVSGSEQNDYKRMLFYILRNEPNPSNLSNLFNKSIILRLLQDRDLKYPTLVHWFNKHRLAIQSLVK